MGSTDAAAADTIETLTPAEAERLLPLSIEAGWNQVAADWRFMLGQGTGFGVRGNGGWAGSALVLPLGDRIAWISMVLVTAAARKRGYGTRLLNSCIETVRRRGLVAGLDATEFGRPVYQGLGFTDVYTLSRWRIDAGGVAAEVQGDCRLVPARTRIDDLVIYDRSRSVLDRAAVLRHLAGRQPEHALIAERPDGRIAGYVLARDGRLATQIGPVVADDPDTARTLVAQALARTPGTAILDIPDAHKDLGRWLADRRGTAPRAFTRMVLGSTPGLETVTNTFALAGPELA